MLKTPDIEQSDALKLYPVYQHLLSGIPNEWIFVDFNVSVCLEIETERLRLLEKWLRCEAFSEGHQTYLRQASILSAFQS